MPHLVFAPRSALSVAESLWWVVFRRSVEGWVANSRQAADRRALAFEKGEGEEEEANAHDTQDDHTWDECGCHCVHLKHWSFQMGWRSTNTKNELNLLLFLLPFSLPCLLKWTGKWSVNNSLSYPRLSHTNILSCKRHTMYPLASMANGRGLLFGFSGVLTGSTLFWLGFGKKKPD